MTPAIRTLRDYQQETVDVKIPDAIKRGWRKICLVSPCGSGKTDIIAEICRRAASKGNTVSVIAHRRNLVKQLAERMMLYGIRFTVEMACLPEDEVWAKRDPGAEIVIGSMQTMFSRLDQNGVRRSKIVIPDESHTINTPAYDAVIKAIGAEYLIGPTATPCTEDGSGFGSNVFNGMVTVTTIQELLARDPQCLVRTNVYAPVAAGKRRRNGLKPGVSGDPVAQWEMHANGLRTVTFCRTIAECRTVVEMFLASGINAYHVNAKSEDRDEAIKRLETDDIKVLVCTPGLIGVGTDIPSLECVQVLTKNESVRAHWQIIGRMQRVAPRKTHGVLLDHSGAVFVHGHPDISPVWSMSEDDSVQRLTIDRGDKDPKNYKPNVCPACGCVSVGDRQCPKCSKILFAESRKEIHNDREHLQEVKDLESHSDGPNPKWLSTWRGMLYAGASQGITLAAAASRFKQKFGVWPEKAGVHPVANFDDRRKKVAEVFPQFIRGGGAAA
jgi:superfamily II DNA or RNA helicase